MNFEKYDHLVGYLRKLESVLVAFSGGVDSSLLLAASIEALGREKVLAVTACSVIDPPGDLQAARELAAGMGAHWQMVESNELQDPQVIANPVDRCYYCKKGLFKQLLALAQEQGFSNVAEGSNDDDLGDIRPGFRAVREAGVLSPLLEVRMTKEDVREAARKRGISCWDRPAGGCLATRIPYGERITMERLTRIGAAESFIRGLGLLAVRVRDHGETARLEVSAESIAAIVRGEVRQQIVRQFKELGYRYVALDLEGYRTGSMN